MKPVIYLDIDDTLLRFPQNESAEWWAANRHGGPANNARAFLVWATTHCEVRWLTFWFTRGAADPVSLRRLSDFLCVTVDLLEKIRNPMAWDGQNKTTGINWIEHRDGRPWLWIEDECLDEERKTLRAFNAEHRFIRTNSSEDPDALTKAWDTARGRFHLRDAA